MPSYRHGAYTVFEIHLHIVWTTKYLKPMLVGEVELRVRELIRQVCEWEEVWILSAPLEIATVRQPIFAAYWMPRCPRPPIP